MATFSPSMMYTAVSAVLASWSSFHGTRSGCRTWSSQPVRWKSAGMLSAAWRSQRQVPSGIGVECAQVRQLTSSVMPRRRALSFPVSWQNFCAGQKRH
ncbi:MAG: hypothetical protein DYH20_11775 [Gammaproteobacteria bacterium PRO9]|nr:hypothetical protein [Gammaproteobacteria bacterium PRO9]